jgi:hypothetical protein
MGGLGTPCATDRGSGARNEPEQRLSYEVTGALWGTSYHTDAKIVQSLTNAVSLLRTTGQRYWSELLETLG